MKDNSFVFAFWLEGSMAANTVDKYSDVDLWLDVKDEEEKSIARKVKKVLTQLAPIDFEHEMSNPHPKIRHYLFHLEGAPGTLVIDLCIQSHSRKFIFIKGMPDHKIKVLFNKRNTIKYQTLNKGQYKKKLMKRINELEKTYPYLIQSYLTKNILRNNFLEALMYYQRFILEPLVELIRFKYTPTKNHHHLKHASRDLPKNILKEIESLYQVNSVRQIKNKTKKATFMFLEYLKLIKKDIK